MPSEEEKVNQHREVVIADYLITRYSATPVYSSNCWSYPMNRCFPLYIINGGNTVLSLHIASRTVINSLLLSCTKFAVIPHPLCPQITLHRSDLPIMKPFSSMLNIISSGISQVRISLSTLRKWSMIILGSLALILFLSNVEVNFAISCACRFKNLVIQFLPLTRSNPSGLSRRILTASCACSIHGGKPAHSTRWIHHTIALSSPAVISCWPSWAAI